jgi:adenylate cyclase
MLTQLGCVQPPARMSDIEGLPPVPTDGTGGIVRAMLSDGCETNDDSVPPGFGVARRLGDDGFVVVCMPLSNDFVADVGEKIAVEIAVLDTDTTGLNAGTPNFPEEVLYGSWGGEDALTSTSDGRTWAVSRVDPAAIVGESQVTLVAALDVSRVSEIVRETIGSAAVFVVLLSLFGFLAGSRIARTMSTALERVSGAMRKLERSEYGHVTGVRTGDELEDLATGFNTMVDGLQERDKLRTTFGKYMTEQVMEHLLAGKVQLGGETLKVTVLFSDIRSFTSLSEKMDAHSLVALLNEYFTDMVAIIIEEGGVVDKYIGDAIMAVFGAPVPKPDDALRAVRAAMRMRTALTALNERLEKRGIEPIRTGIGLHTGDVVAGNIGSEARMEYTVIGDAVNLASRLESSTKDLGVDVLISSDTYALVSDACVCRPQAEMKVKGRDAPVTTYAVDAMREK